MKSERMFHFLLLSLHAAERIVTTAGKSGEMCGHNRAHKASREWMETDGGGEEEDK
jgi:hypothetical protein